MNCPQINRYIFDYCDGNLSSHHYQMVKQHLFHCLHCQHLVDLVEQESDILKNELDLPELPVDFTSQVMNKIIDKYGDVAPAPYLPSTTIYKSRFIGYWIASALTTALLLIVLISPQAMHFLTFNDNNSQPPVITGSSPNTFNSITAQQLADDITAAKGEADLSENTGETPVQPESVRPAANNTTANIPSAAGEAEQNIPISDEEELLGTADIQDTANPDLLDRHNPAGGYEISSPAVTNEMYSLTPVNIPDEYILTQIAAVTENEMVYNYQADDNTVLELIVISPDHSQISRALPEKYPELLKASSAETAKEQSQDEKSGSTGSSAQADSEEKMVNDNSYSWIIVVNNAEYYLTLSSQQADQRQLAELAAAIQLEGANPSDTAQ